MQLTPCSKALLEKVPDCHFRIRSLLWNLKDNYPVHKIRINLDQTLLYIHLRPTIIFSHTTRSSKWSLSVTFFSQKCNAEKCMFIFRQEYAGQDYIQVAYKDLTQSLHFLAHIINYKFCIHLYTAFNIFRSPR